MKRVVSSSALALSLVAAVIAGISAARGGVQATSNSTIQRRFEVYWEAVQPPAGASVRGDYEVAGEKYDKLFGSEQTAQNVRNVSSHDLNLLFRAAYLAADYTFRRNYVHDMFLDLAEMERRSSVPTGYYKLVYKVLVNDRMFRIARRFYRNHEHAGLARLPHYIDNARHADGEPTVLAVDASHNRVVRKDISLDTATKIIILTDPHCHFCANFLAALHGRPKVRRALERHALWLTPPGGLLEFATLQSWNRSHPRQPIEIMYKLRDWPMVKIVEVPTFYFLKNGSVIKTVRGWPEGGNFRKLRAGLHRLGLLN